MVPHQMKRHWRSLLLATALLVLILAVVAVGLLFSALRTPYKGFEGESVTVLIPPGSTTRQIVEQLQKAGVLRDRRLGLASLKLLHSGQTLKAGEYRFFGARTPEQAIVSLVAGDVVTHRFTFPEGISADEVAAQFVAEGFGTQAEYVSLMAKPATFRGVPKGAPSLEGFLFPETYSVTRFMSLQEILGLMTHEFRRRLPPGYEKKAEDAGLTLLQAVTLASLVEKETSLAAERAVVAAVYRNRLTRGMLLQCDPTTIYALRRLGRWRGYLTRSDLAVDESYNTYVRPGLPPGPICNPGLATLQAALQPAKVDYLYFVADGDGGHRFARAYSDQEKNVALYRESRRASEEAEKQERAPQP